MKFKELMRVTQARASKENGPVIVHPLFSTNKDGVLGVVTGTPGLSSVEVANKLFASKSEDYAAISRTLYDMVHRAKEPTIKGVKLDGMMRFYPINYRLTTDSQEEMSLENKAEGTAPTKSNGNLKPTERSGKHLLLREDVVQALKDHPGKSTKQLASILGQTGGPGVARVSTHLGTLVRLGVVARKGKRPRFKHYFVEGAALPPVNENWHKLLAVITTTPGLTASEVLAKAGFAANRIGMLHKMVNKGVLAKRKLDMTRYYLPTQPAPESYKPGEVVKEVGDGIKVEPVEEVRVPQNSPHDAKQWLIASTIVQLAHEYYFDTQDDSLHGFVKHITGKLDNGGV